MSSKRLYEARQRSEGPAQYMSTACRYDPSCVTPIGSIGNKGITTIEAIGKTPQGRVLQQAWLELEVVQCGYC
jgi:aerobic-type carbon monoxide dehydrogenase small subunit (CoxS/CutS family)